MSQQELELPKGWIRPELRNILRQNVSYGILKAGSNDPNGILMLTSDEFTSIP